MALFNKLFASRTRKTFAKCQDNVREKLFTFSQEQVRVTVFRECDFRGRKLLFDSLSVQMEALPPNMTDSEKLQKKYVEINKGRGFTYTKPNSDVAQLGEMIFGTVAMSYRGTTSKMHSLLDPKRIVCSQVFPSPKSTRRLRSSAPGHIHTNTVSNLEQSVRLEDSGGSSGTSCSDQSVQSAASDTLLVCRRNHSTPLDVPLNASLISSSGYGGEHSNSSINSGPQSIPFDLNQGNSQTYSNGNLCKRWLRSTSTSLDHSTNSIPGSTDEGLTKPHVRSSKIGLAILLQLSEGQEDHLEQFLLEHAALVDSILWRLRQGVESAYIKHTTFVSTMYEWTLDTAQWFVNFLTGACLSQHVWRSLSSNCDSSNNNPFSIKPKPGRISSGHLNNSGELQQPRSHAGLFGNAADFTFLNLSKLLKLDGGEHHPGGGNQVADEFMKELCELLESIEGKQTNFFVSTLLTAVLTHHLGWVSTVYSLGDHQLSSSCNPLWGQLTDLYGAIGFPTKMAYTIVTGTTKAELISKVLNILTYFIRCTNIKRTCLMRSDIPGENEEADKICLENSCIPKENFKKFEDHLREMESNKTAAKVQVVQKTLKKTHTSTSLNKMIEEEAQRSVQTAKSELHSNLLRCNTILESEEQQLVDISEAKQQIERIFPARKPPKFETEEDKNVVFVLGDDEKLVGLRPTNLQVKKTSFYCESDSSPDSEVVDFDLATACKPSTSCSNLTQLETRSYTRAQSEPPELPKYRHSGYKFNFQQYPQIAKNYMRSKNIEMSNMQLEDKMKFETLPSVSMEFSKYHGEFEEEPLTTPSNASELEFTSDLVIEKPVKQIARTKKVETTSVQFVRTSASNTVVKEPDAKELKDCKNFEIAEDDMRLKIVELPMPKTLEIEEMATIAYTKSLMRDIGENYISNMVLQGTTSPKHKWSAALKMDLIASTRHSLLDQPIDESIAIIANTDTWEVQLMSSHTYVIDKNSSGVPVGMSQLVANMLESILFMWRHHTPAEHCLVHIEQKLQEYCIKSNAVARLLLETDFCNMELLTSSLQLEVNDVPLLMAIASTHSPEVTQKYGLSFQ